MRDVTTNQDPANPESSSGRFWLHAAALLVLLVVLTPFAAGSSITIPDEAVYSAQTKNLSHGSWSSLRPVPDLDPIGQFDPIAGTNMSADSTIPYSRHATYPVLLTPFYMIGGRLGMVLLSVLGLWGTALSGAMLTRILVPRLAAFALWVIGLGSPLVFYGYTVTAHSLAAALTGLTFLAVYKFALNDCRTQVLYFVPGVMGMVLLRSEGSVIALALGLSLVIVGIMQLRVAGLRSRALISGLIVMMIAGSSYLLDNQLVKMITGVTNNRADPTTLVLGKQTGPWNALWVSLLRPFDGEGLNAQPLIILAMVALIAAGLALRLMPNWVLLPVALIGLSTFGAVTGLVLGAPGFITGFLAACPLVPAGLVQFRFRRLHEPLTQVLVLTSVLGTIGLLLTVYGIGGASEWGGRFFQILIPCVVPVALIGWAEMIDRIGRPWAPVVLVCLLVISLSFSTLALVWGRTLRDTYGKWVRDVVELGTNDRRGADGDVERSSKPLVLVTGIVSSGRSRYFWDSLDSLDVLNVEVPDILAVLESADRTGYEKTLVTGQLIPGQFSVNFAEALTTLNWRLEATVQHDLRTWSYWVVRGDYEDK